MAQRDATAAAVEHGTRGVYNVVDDDPAPVVEWVPKQPLGVPRRIGRLFAEEPVMTEIRGASNAKAERELEWRPAHASRRQGLAAA